MILTYTGTFKQNLLMDELLTVFPEWLINDTCLLQLEGNNEGVRLIVPDDAIESEIETVINAHDPNVLSVGEVISLDVETALDGFKNLPDYATWTPNEAEQYVTNTVLNGWDKTAANSWIDANVTNIESARTAMKQLAGAIIDIRKILSLVAKMLMWLRNIIIRTR